MTGALLDRRLVRLVDDEALHQRLQAVGFAVVGPLLDEHDLRRLRDLHRDLDEQLGGIGGPWFTTGMLSDRADRRRVFDEVGQVLLPKLAPHLSEDAVAISGNLHVNPVHREGGLGPHQDISIVDESTSSTLNGWVGLQDSTADNGALRFVPASHRFGNVDRSLSVPWAYEGLHDLFWEHSVQVEVPAGHLILFDTAMVHASTPNRSSAPRVAANCLVRERGRPLRHLAAADGGEVLVHEVGEVFLIEGDVSGSPRADEGRLLGRRPRIMPPTSPDEVRDQCLAGMALVG